MPTILPFYPTRFIGRKREIEEIKRLLNDVRLLTLTGVSGSGKTRLAHSVVEDMASLFPDGITWVELGASIGDQLVSITVASALEIRDQSPQPVLEQIAAYLESKKCLLVLDSCERGIRGCADLVTTLLQSCLHLRVLVTSQIILGISYEQPYPVPPLTLPINHSKTNPDQLLEFDGIQLFVERARIARFDFALNSDNSEAVTHICQRLDGLPLAIELAAARVKALSPQEIEARLDNVFKLLTGGSSAGFPRHQTLQAAIDWSYDLLPTPEKTALQRLSVFVGGFSLEAVCALYDGSDFDEFVVLNLLEQLIDKSFVVLNYGATTTRYRLLDVIHQYGQNKLNSVDRISLLKRHASFYLYMVEKLGAALDGRQQNDALQQLEVEYDNILRAQTWLQEHGEPEARLRFGVGLWRFWEWRGDLSKGREWLETALAEVSEISSIVRAKALYGVGTLALNQSDYTRAQEAYQASLEIQQHLDDSYGIALVLCGLGVIANIKQEYVQAEDLFEASLSRFNLLGNKYRVAETLFHLAGLAQSRHDYPKAKEGFKESITLYRELDDKRGLAAALNGLGQVARSQGDYLEAQVLQEQSLALFQELKERQGQARVLSSLGILAQQQGDYNLSRRRLEESLRLRKELGDKSGTSDTLNSLGELARCKGEYIEAKNYYEEVLRLATILDQNLVKAWALHNLGYVARHNGDYQQAQVYFRNSLDLFQTLGGPEGNLEGIAACIEGWAGVMTEQGLAERAARLLGFAEALRKQIGVHLWPADQVEHRRNVAAVLANLAQTELTELWTQGRTLTLIQVTADMLTNTTTVSSPGPTLEPSVTPDLRIYALGDSCVYRNERLLTRKTDWVFKKTSELLFYLLTHSFKTKEQIGAALWPEPSSKQPNTIFKTVMYHLRKALGGSKWIIFQDDRYTFNRNLPYWYDVEVFEARLNEAQRLKSVTPDEAIRKLETVIDLYKGDFLDGIVEGDWIEIKRSELLDKYLTALFLLGELYLAVGCTLEAMKAYQMAIQRDDHREEAYRGLMRCLARQGEYGQALRLYQMLKDLVRSPSPETVNLMKRLERGEPI